MPDLFEAVDLNLRAAMCCYAAGPAGEVCHRPGVSISSSGIDYSVFNAAMLTQAVQSVEEVERALATASTHYRMRGLGWSFWLCENLLDDVTRQRIPEILRRNRLRLVAEAPGMYAVAIPPPDRALAHLTVRRVEDARTRFDFVDIASIVFSVPTRVASNVYGPESIWNTPMTGYVGYLGEKPVSVATTVAAAGVVGLYSLGTLPQHQRCGFGETLMRHALTEGRLESGFEASVLQTTKAGMNLYRRMGFRIVSNFSIHVSESCGAF